MEKVYIVTQGIYSDYHIEGVFTTYEEAVEAVRRAHMRGEYEFQIEEFPLNKDMPRTDDRIWEVYMDGYMWHIEETNQLWHRKPVLNDDGEFQMEVFAKTKGQAFKIGFDTYAKMRAEREGL